MNRTFILEDTSFDGPWYFEKDSKKAMPFSLCGDSVEACLGKTPKKIQFDVTSEHSRPEGTGWISVTRVVRNANGYESVDLIIGTERVNFDILPNQSMLFREAGTDVGWIKITDLD